MLTTRIGCNHALRRSGFYDAEARLIVAGVCQVLVTEMASACSHSQKYASILIFERGGGYYIWYSQMNYG